MSSIFEITASVAHGLMAAIAFLAEVTGANPLLVGTWIRRISIEAGMPDEVRIYYSFWLEGDRDRVYKLFIDLKKVRTLNRKRDSYWMVLSGQGTLLKMNSAVEFFTIGDKGQMVVHGSNSIEVRQKDVVW